ncbi:MAG: hypothetical protein Q9219_006748 [cf. Caloplaca sp. 3 TL-2023]
MSSKAGPVSHYLSQVETNTRKYLEYFESKGLPEPSYETGDSLNSLEPPPNEVAAFRDAALEAADELHHLLLGPLGLLLSSPGDVSTIHGSLGGRLMLLAIFNVEPAIHLPAPDSAICSSTRRRDMVDATKRWPESEEPNESGYSLAYNTNENPFNVIKKDPRRNAQFVTAMDYSHMHPSYGVHYLVDNYDFGSIGAGTVVDVGGSHGQVSIEIVRRHPEIKCIVQDLPDTIAGLNSRVPKDLRGSISGMEHDFLTPQPVEAADVYLFRWIFHDWSDKYCVSILRCLIPALKKGAKIVISDICIPPPGQLGIAADRNLRLMDISMKAFNNARERDPETWAMLFTEADQRYEFKGITMPPEARMAIILAEWNGN